MLDKLGLSEEKVESLLEGINIHCFKARIDKSEFISTIDKMFNLANTLNISIYDIDSIILQKVIELEQLNKIIIEKREQINQKFEDYYITLKDLEEYRISKPLLHTIKRQEPIVNDQREKISELEEKVNEDNLDFLWMNVSSSLRKKYNS
jgi:hypothetical protein